MKRNIEVSMDQMVNVFERGSIFGVDDVLHRHINISCLEDTLVDMYWYDEDGMEMDLTIKKSDVKSIIYDKHFEEYRIETDDDKFEISVFNLEPVLPSIQ